MGRTLARCWSRSTKPKAGVARLSRLDVAKSLPPY
jgi:hypothetical protein